MQSMKFDPTMICSSNRKKQGFHVINLGIQTRSVQTSSKWQVGGACVNNVTMTMVKNHGVAMIGFSLKGKLVNCETF
eukprot:UN00306